VAQIGEAVTQMDQATQQNAALVEEMAAAAGSLRGQAQDLVQAVAVFKLDAQATRPAAPTLRANSRPSPSYQGQKHHTAIPLKKPAVARLDAPQAAAPVRQTAHPADNGDWTSF